MLPPAAASKTDLDGAARPRLRILTTASRIRAALGLVPLAPRAAVLTAALGLALTTAAPAMAATAPNCVASPRNGSAALDESTLTVSPMPGSMDASAQVQLSLLGVPVSRLKVISVTGSRSGVHAGQLKAYSQGDGASFVPTTPFTAGETVTARVQVLGGVAPGPVSWSFTIAEPVVTPASTDTAVPAPASGTYQHFVSRPDLTPPPIDVTTTSGSEPPGNLFLSPYTGPGRYGPMIVDGKGQIVWDKPLALGTRAADFRAQQLDGQPVLTWWQDPLVSGGLRSSGIVIANSSYQDIVIVRAGNGYQPDLHEFTITPRDTGLLTVYAGIRCNLSKVGGPADGAVADTLFQEIDLRTGLVMYEWHSVDHVPLADSYVSPLPGNAAAPFDFFHINSIQILQDGSFLVDARNTWAAYDVNAITGKVLWALGGRHPSFAMGPGTRTAWQHDARQLPGGDITFFDNGATPKVHPQSRLIVEKLDFTARTATLVSSFVHPTPLSAGSQGDFEALPGGDWITGWGQIPYFSLFDATGKVLFDAHLPSSYENYRAYWFPWTGTPAIPPAVAVRPAASGHGDTVYASWNGATQVVAWRVMAGSSTSSLQPGPMAARTGFETAIAMTATARVIEVQALGSAGEVLGTSATVRG